MEKSYETFVTDLRKLLLAAMDLKEEEIYFSNDGEKYGCLGDRLFVESGHMEKAKTEVTYGSALSLSLFGIRTEIKAGIHHKE